MGIAEKSLAPLRGEKLKAVQRADSTDRYTLICHAGRSRSAKTTSVTFIGKGFQGAFKKIGQPTKGKYSNVPTSSEQFAANKQEEIDLEEHSQ